jgi:hypothetical protein
MVRPDLSRGGVREQLMCGAQLFAGVNAAVLALLSEW